MNLPDDKLQPDLQLRATAEAQLARAEMIVPPVRPAEELLHELRVHQIELEMQNETLRQTQLALKESRDRYLDLYEFAPVGYLTLSAEGMIEQINLTGAALLGRERRNLLRREFTSLVIVDDQDRWIRHFQGVKQQDDEQGKAELVLQRGDGTTFHAQIDCTHSGGSIFGVRVALSDITARKQRVEALLESERFAQATVDALSANLATLDESGIIVAVNRAWRRFAEANGVESGSVSEGVNYLAVCDAATGSRLEGALEMAAGIRSVLQGALFQFELEYRCDSPTEERWFVGRVTRFPGEGATRIVVAHEDITERKRAENLIRQAHKAMRQLTTRINALHEAESHLLSRELHDEFGQMLTSLKMDLTWLASELGEERQELKEKVASSVALVEASVHSVRSIAARLRPRILDELGLMPAIEWAVRDFRERSGVDTEVVSNTQARALAPEQATAVFRIVQESLTNALRHARAKRVDISLDADAGWLTLEIRDDGMGMSEGATTSYESIGLLGMRERALAAGGELALESVFGKGTIVSLRLPLKEGEA